METTKICCLLILLIHTCIGYTYTGNVTECANVEPGETIQRLGQCEECICTKPFASCHGCGVFHRGPLSQDQLDRGCYVEDPDKSLMYPDCCQDKLICPEQKQKPAAAVVGRKSVNMELMKALVQFKHVVESQNSKQRLKTLATMLRWIRNLKTA